MTNITGSLMTTIEITNKTTSSTTTTGKSRTTIMTNHHFTGIGSLSDAPTIEGRKTATGKSFPW